LISINSSFVFQEYAAIVPKQPKQLQWKSDGHAVVVLSSGKSLLKTLGKVTFALLKSFISYIYGLSILDFIHRGDIGKSAAGANRMVV